MSGDWDDFPIVGALPSDTTKEKILEYINRQQDAARYRWLRDNVFDVLCEGRPADCIAKWMLPRLVAEDSTGRKYTFDEIIDIQMKRGQPNE